MEVEVLLPLHPLPLVLLSGAEYDGAPGTICTPAVPGLLPGGEELKWSWIELWSTGA